MEIHSGSGGMHLGRRRGKRFRHEFEKQLPGGVQIAKSWESVLKHNLQLYKIPPVDNISLLEFESLAIERLKVLKVVECAGQCYKRGSDEYTNYLTGEFRKLNFKLGFKFTSVDKATEAEEVEDRRRDHIGHFILRLAFCRSPDQKAWFLQQEGDLFKHRFGLEGPRSITTFLHLNGLQYNSVEGKSLDADTLQNIADSTSEKTTSSSVKSQDIFQVPFTDVLDLVKNRKVFIEDGIAFVLRNDLIYLVAAKFRTELSRSLTIASKYFGFMHEQDRLVPILKRLSSKAYVGKDYTNTEANQITPDMIDSLAESSFPLCMQQLHKHLRRDHHLKHGGRMQYGLFLKGIGMSLNDAMTFWRSEFTRIIDPDKFEKQYAYNIRHNYGKEGKRADYTPYSCIKIISSNKPGPQDNHGCPFQEMDSVILRQQLETLQISGEDCSKILALSKSRQFDRACTRFFECTHKIPENSLNQLISHPNHYFEESRKFRSGEKTAMEAVPTIHSQMFESQNSTTTDSAPMASQSEQD